MLGTTLCGIGDCKVSKALRPVSLNQNAGNAGGRHDPMLALRVPWEIRPEECIAPFEACFALYSPVGINWISIRSELLIS